MRQLELCGPYPNADADRADDVGIPDGVRGGFADGGVQRRQGAPVQRLPGPLPDIQLCRLAAAGRPGSIGRARRRGRHRRRGKHAEAGGCQPRRHSTGFRPEPARDRRPSWQSKRRHGLGRPGSVRPEGCARRPVSPGRQVRPPGARQGWSDGPPRVARARCEVGIAEDRDRRSGRGNRLRHRREVGRLEGVGRPDSSRPERGGHLPGRGRKGSQEPRCGSAVRRPANQWRG